jgi:hypothetical protein
MVSPLRWQGGATRRSDRSASDRHLPVAKEIEVMKNIVLAALLAAAVIPAAQAQVHQPTSGATYVCSYTNPAMHEKSPGLSTFSLTAYYGGTLLRGIENFQAYYQNQLIWDNRKVSFSEPVDFPSPTDPDVIASTRWHFSIDPAGPTCNVLVRNLGRNLIFTGCSDGSSRSCTRSY